MPDPAGMGPVAPWPAPFSPAFIEQARTLLELRHVLVIVAPVGASRQQLASDIAEAPEGPVWFRHVARFGEKGRRYFALQQFFPHLRIGPDDGPDDVGAAVRTALTDIEHERPRLVLVNANLCDPESVELLVRFASAGLVRLIAILTPETVDGQEVLLSAAEVIDIPPLDASRVGELLEARFGVRVHPLLVDLMMTRTGGSYSAVRDIADASFAAGLFVTVENVMTTSPDAPAGDSFQSWLAPRSIERNGGGEQVTDLIELTALLGRLDLDDAEECVPPAVIELAIAHGTFTVDRNQLVFAWAAEEVLVVRGLPAERHRELFDKYAAHVSRSLVLPSVAVRAADWWMTVGRPLPVDLAVRAAREANFMGRHRRAVLYTDPTVNEEKAAIALTERAYALAELGDDAALEELMGGIDPATLTEDELLVYLRWAPRSSDGADRDALVERAVAATDPVERRRRAAVRTLADLLERTFDTASDEIVNRLRSLAFSSQLSPCNRATAFAVLSAVLRQAARPAQALGAAEFALRILADEHETASAFHLDMAHELHVLALISSADLDGADHAARAYSSGVFAHPGSGRMTMALQVLIGMIQGDVQGSLASARLCLAGLRPHDPHQIRGWVEAMLAQILVQCDREPEAHEFLTAAERHPSGRRQIDLARRMTVATVRDGMAEPEEALRILADVADEAQAHGLRMALIDASVLSAHIGGPPHLPGLLEVVDDLVDPSGTPLIWQSFAHAVHRYDLVAMTEMAEQLSVRGMRLYAGQVAQYVLDMARRATDLDPDTRVRLHALTDPVATPST
ncbi:MAG: hypothetical protein ABW004_01565 [Aeromicrobium sp.]